MNYDTCTITIDWNNLSQEITDIDGTNPREMHWNVPHAVYKSETPLDDLAALGSPQAILDLDTFQYVDEYVTYDKTYYYRLSEMRPGGEFFTEQVKILVKLHILRYEAPYLANIEYNDSKRDGNGNLVRYEQFDLTELDDDENVIEVIRDEWYWNGTGRISEWLEFIVNDVTIDIRMRGTFDRSLKTIIHNEDRRNYPAGKIGTMPVMSTSVSLGRDNLVQTPYWWAEWHENVKANDPLTWHNFWESRMGIWDDTEEWYERDWTTKEETVEYDGRPHDHMMDAGNVAPYEPEIRDLVLRANIGTTLINGQYTGEYFNADTGEDEMGTVLGIPRPGNSAGVGLGATLTFKNVRRGLKNGATIRFRYENVNYSVTITGLPNFDPNDERMKEVLEQQLNAPIGTIPDGAAEPFIAVSFGPLFHVL